MNLIAEPYLIHAIADGAKVECRDKFRNTQTDDRWTEVTTKDTNNAYLLN
jgi:hypothetical protein